MKIPELIEQKIKPSNLLNGLAVGILGRIESHIAANKMEFFPEFTDHSISHLEKVMETAVDLVTAESRELLTEEDAVVLALAVGLHDLGMYITRDGFESLIAPNSQWKGIDGLDKISWKVLWDDFFAEASRFDGRKLRSLFGDSYKPVHPLPPEGEPWGDFDRLLVGEFVRRYHPRLAHEIAIYGMPGKKGQAVPICAAASSSSELIELSGLVARSHGFPLRQHFDYLQKKYGQKICPRNVHVPYLMVLLRIADYFQIQSSRAPSEYTDVVTLKSPISIREWNVHQCVKDMHTTKDPETLQVEATPSDVSSFLRLRDWLTDIQFELDSSWAGLGEVYGLQYHTKKNELGIRFRRIRSNIDDIEEFSKSVEYIPAKLAFEAANADLLKLLVGPLYGESPSIGIRELIQNAVDAVRELDDLILRETDVQESARYQQQADVVLYVAVNDEGNPTEVKVTDRGVGMSLTVLRDFFLKVGASYRSSDAWKKAYTDESGASHVLRTGRFGVGALASFLLGDQIKVTTRHFSVADNEGLQLTATIDSDSIDVRRVVAPIGTSITVQLKNESMSKLRTDIPDPNSRYSNVINFRNDFGHYFLTKPSLARIFSKYSEPIPVNQNFPLESDEEKEPWRRFKAKGFGNIFWTYSSDWPPLAVNGIVITDNEHFAWHSTNEKLEKYRHYRRERHAFDCPNLSVYDSDAILPINLERTSLTSSQVPFSNELLIDIADDVIAHALLTCPSKCEGKWLVGTHAMLGTDRSRSRYDMSEAIWIATRKGVFLSRSSFLRNSNYRYSISVYGTESEFDKLIGAKRFRLPDDVILRFYPIDTITTHDVRNKGLLMEICRGGHLTSPLGDSAVFVSKKNLKIVSELKPGKAMRKLLSEFKKLKIARNWVLFGKGATPQFDLFEKVFLPVFADSFVPNLYLRVDKLVHNADGKEDIDPIHERWMDVLSQEYIPFDAVARAKIFEKAVKRIRSKLKLNKNELNVDRAKKSLKSRNGDIVNQENKDDLTL